MNARLAASAPEPELVLEYELFDMPTAQHKAGLAGLILHLKNLEKREVTPRPRIESVAPQSARFRFTQRDFQTLFDDLYDGYWTEARVRQKYQNKDPKRIEEVKSVEGKKTEKWFIYDEFRPRGSVLGFYLQEATNSPWLKLWQDMLWSVLRAQPTTRGEYQRRADGDSVSFADELWGKLVKSQTQKNRLVTTSIAGSLFVGAQDQNAEQVPFQGRIEHNLLLHFWTWVTPIFVPQVVNLKDKQREYQGYLLAIPEVADLEEFIEAVTEFWQSLSPDISGYRPRGALIDLPEEGGLEFLYYLARHRIKQQDLNNVVLAVELYHQEKQGNNVRLLAAERLIPNARVLAEYERLRDPSGNPLFKSLRIRNLITGQRWHDSAQSLFTTYPWEYFIYGPKSPQFRFFGADVKRHFKALTADLERQEQAAMQEKTPERLDDTLARRVYRLISVYVRQRAESRSGIKLDNLARNEQGHRIYPPPYREALQKVASDAFLAMRGRTDRDFIEYFTGTICSVPQYFGKEDEFVEISQALIDSPATVKNLAMLALSAHSWLPSEKNHAQPDAE